MHEDNTIQEDSNKLLTLNELKSDLQNNTQKLRNSFPIDIFPKEIKDFIIDEENSLNSDRNFLSSSIISAISLTIGNSFNLEIKQTYTVKGNLYIAIVGRTGMGKSHPMKKAYKPLQHKQTEYIEKYKRLLAEWEKDQNTPKPTYQKIYLNDFTIEALMQIHDHNPMGIGVFADELLGWFSNMSRYSNGSDKETYLSLWNGDPINVDRVGRSIIVKSSFLNIIGGIQPSKLKEIINASLDSNGFVHRILWVPPITDRFIPESDKEPHPYHYENYETIVNHILTYREKKETVTIRLNDEAKKRLLQWRNDFKQKYHYEEEYLRAASIKLTEYANRFTLILTVLNCALFEIRENATKDLKTLEAGVDVVEKSIRLTEYFMYNVKNLRKEMSNPLNNRSKKFKEWYKKLPKTFITKDAHEVGEKLKISVSSVEKYLTEELLFEKIKHGEYKKKNL